MQDQEQLQLTDILKRWGTGEEAALDELVPVVYSALRLMAARQLGSERSGHTLQPTALVHEAYLKLRAQRAVVWQNRTQFFCVAAHLMRRILADHARRKQAAKRDPGRIQMSLEVADERPATGASDVLIIEDALTRLESMDPRQARIAELRFFAGLTIDETAEALAISTATVKREWRLARAWLHRHLAEGGTCG